MSRRQPRNRAVANIVAASDLAHQLAGLLQNRRARNTGRGRHGHVSDGFQIAMTAAIALFAPTPLHSSRCDQIQYETF